jgi:hypothetical protein
MNHRSSECSEMLAKRVIIDWIPVNVCLLKVMDLVRISLETTPDAKKTSVSNVDSGNGKI